MKSPWKGKRKNAIRCNHRKPNPKCKKCRNPIDLMVEQWLTHSKETDKQRGHWDAQRFVDKPYLLKLLKGSGKKCCICHMQINYGQHNKKLASLHRLDNSKGHNKGNVVITCLKCNIKQG